MEGNNFHSERKACLLSGSLKGETQSPGGDAGLAGSEAAESEGATSPLRWEGGRRCVSLL